MGNMENLLARCLTEMEHGSSVEECLARHPERHTELEPLLRAAHHIRSTPEVTPSAAFRSGARERMIHLIRARQSTARNPDQPKPAGLLERLRSTVGIRRAVGRFALPAVATMAIILLLGTLGIGAVYASSASVPGDSLYGVKLAGEQVRLAASLSPNEDARLRLKFAAERLEEAGALVERDAAARIAPLMRRYVAEVEAASGILQRQRDRDRDVAALASHLQEQLEQQQTELSRIRDQVSQDAQPAVEHALTASRAALLWTLEPGDRPGMSPTAKQEPTTTDTHQPAAGASRTPVPGPSRTPGPTAAAESELDADPADVPNPPGHTHTPEPPGRTYTPAPPGQTRTPEPPGRTNTPAPPGLTRTPEPPGPTYTPAPPGLTRTPEPPGRTYTPQPPGQTRTPEPPGRTYTPAPPGQTHTPEPPGRTYTPQPPGSNSLPGAASETRTPGPP